MIDSFKEKYIFFFLINMGVDVSRKKDYRLKYRPLSLSNRDMSNDGEKGNESVRIDNR